MGMYSHGPYIDNVKMSGLLATCVIEAAQRKYMGHTYAGVWLTDDGLIDGGVVTLKRDEVNAVVTLMREKFIQGQAKEYDHWYTSLHSISRSPVHSLLNLQDILTFERDVAKFSALVHWLAHTEEDEIVWA